ncbi:MAG: MMPL family transporter, partial [Chloroflexi bacterium]|nr:MMPL family transporter [Chloroflexota bacterium]
MFLALARWVYRWRWAIIAAWGALLVVGLLLAPRASSRLKGGFGEVDTESRRALSILERDLGLTPTVHTLVYHSDRLTVDEPVFRQEMQASLRRVEALPAVHRLVSLFNSPSPFLVSADRRTTYALLWMDLSADEGLQRVGAVREAVRTPALETWVTGAAAIFADLNAVSERDLRRAEIITLPIVLIALLVVFGTAVAAALPLMIGVVSLVITLAILYLVSQVT